MMSGGRSNHTENLVLIAATAFLVIAVQHYFQADTPPSSATPNIGPAVSQQRSKFARELSQEGRGRSGLRRRARRNSSVSRLAFGKARRAGANCWSM